MKFDLIWAFTDESKQYDHERPPEWACCSKWVSRLQKEVFFSAAPLSSFVYVNKIKVNKSWHRGWVLLNKLFIHLAAAFSFDLTEGTQWAGCEP